MNRFLFACLALALSACSAQLTERGRFDSDGGYSNREEARFYRLLNSLRMELNVAPVLPDARLNEAARKHSEWMLGMNDLTHDGPSPGGTSYTRAVAEGIDGDSLVSENIARGNFDARETFEQWLFSPSHLLGMIAPEYDHVGISRSNCTPDTASDCFWTTDFAQLTASMPSNRQFTVEEVARAAEAVIGPLGERRSEISLDESSEKSR